MIINEDSSWEDVLRAVRMKFGDTSVPPDVTASELKSLRDEIDVLIDSLK